MDWPLSMYLKQRQGKCMRERMRELIPHLPKPPEANEDDLNDTEEKLEKQYYQCSYLRDYFAVIHSEFMNASRRMMKRHEAENMLISKVRFAFESSGALLQTHRYIESTDCRLFWQRLEDILVCGGKTPNLQKAVACRALFQDEPHLELKKIKLTEQEKQECEEAAKQFLASMKESELTQAMAQSTPVAKLNEQYGAVVKAKTHFEKRKSKPELLLQRTMCELSDVCPKKKSAKMNKTLRLHSENADATDEEVGVFTT